jgi:Entner-Doudoroff aldolase
LVTTPAAGEVFDQCLMRARVMVILRGLPMDAALEQTRRAWRLGLPLVEIPVQSDADLEVLCRVVAEARGADRLVGAGTVTSVELLDQVIAAGASFTVAPGLDEEVLRASSDSGVPHLPGVATASEVQRALQLGQRWLKAFPATQLGAGWFSAMAGPFPEARFVATGGVDADNAGQFLEAGAAAVSLGSSFASVRDDAVRALLAE